MKKQKLTYPQNSIDRFDVFLSRVSRLTGYSVGCLIAWFFFVNNNPKAVQALPVAYFFIRFAQNRTIAQVSEDKLKDKQ